MQDQDGVEPDQHRIQASADGEGTAADRRPRGWAGWLISAGCHSALLLIMMGVYWVVRQPVMEPPPLRVRPVDACAGPQQPTPPSTTARTVLELQVPVPETDVQTLPSMEPETVAEEPPSSDQPQQDPVPQGREGAVSEIEAGSAGVMMAIGISSHDGGPFGGRTPGGKDYLNRLYQNTPRGVDAVARALRWFRRHQSPDGGWDAVGYARNCGQEPRCEPGVVDHGSVEAAEVAMTGYALLCFLGAGYDHVSPTTYKSVVKKGLDYLLSVQHADGYLGERNYEHAIATMALAEALAMSGDPALRGPAQRAVDQIVSHQNQLGASAGSDSGSDSGYGSGLGWDYVGPSARNDSSVSGWNVMALKSARMAGLDTGHGLEGARRWLETAWKLQNPGWAALDPYTGESRFPYTCTITGTGTGSSGGATEISAAPAAGQPGANDHDLSCVGGICAVFLGHHLGDPMLESLSNYIMHHQLPTRFPCNAYYMYYNTLTIFQCGGAKWRTWNATVRDLLVQAQRRGDGCFDGSWDAGSGSFIGSEYGRILTTAYCTLSLEVYYRYARLAGARQ